MSLASRRRRGIDFWPGFVDALSTLLLAIMFLLTVFVVAQFILGREISGKDEVLNRLNSQINELTQLLALEQSGKQDLEDTLANLQSSLASSERMSPNMFVVTSTSNSAGLLTSRAAVASTMSGRSSTSG